MKRVLCLYRVSTKGQVDPKDDIPVQRRECMRFIENHHDWVLNSGVFSSRVRFQALPQLLSRITLSLPSVLSASLCWMRK